MILPRTYTIGDTLDALYRMEHGARATLANSKKEYEDYLKPYMKKVWFGFYREVTNSPDSWDARYLRRHIKYCEDELKRITERRKRLRKYPLNAKVGLDEEDMEWFGDRLYHRDDYSSKGQ